MRWAGAVLFGALSGACMDASGLLAGAPCPCTDGYVCCQSTQTCLAEGQCPAGAPPVFRVDEVVPARGDAAGGEPVEVHGEGFEPSMQVFVDGTACPTTTFHDATRLGCVTPAARGVGTFVSVSVQREDGVTLVLQDAFRYSLPQMTEVESSGIAASALGTGITVWDVNGDGRRDLVFANTDDVDSGAALLMNAGDLAFEPAEDLAWARAVGRFSASVVADFDGDGDEDLFLGNHRSVAAPHLLRRGGDGGFGVETLPLEGGGGVMGASAFDLDGDGAVDVVGCTDGRLEAPYYFGHNEGGTLEDRSEDLPEAPMGTACRGNTVADFDRDGDPDVVFCGATLTLLVNEAGALTDQTEARGLRRQIADDETAQCGAVQWVDIDLDGDLDLSVTPFTNFVTGTRALLNSGTLLFENRLETGRADFVPLSRLDAPAADALLCELGQTYLTPGGALLGGGRSGVWLDVDLDGDQDLLSLMPSVYCVTRPWLYESRFSEGVSRLVPRALAAGPILTNVTGAVFEDLDGDGDLDVVSNQWGGPGGRAMIRNNLAEDLGEAPRHVVVRGWRDGAVLPGLTFELDLDGPEAGADFAPGVGKLRVAASGSSSQSGSPAAEAWFGLAGVQGPVWVRTSFPGGAVVVARVEEGEVQVDLLDD